jgi:hypothetical protein
MLSTLVVMPIIFTENKCRVLLFSFHTSAMQLLANRITERLKTHKYCTVFETELSRVWPFVDKERAQRHAQILEFARAHGWSATILDPGIRVTFRQLSERDGVNGGDGQEAAAKFNGQGKRRAPLNRVLA